MGRVCAGSVWARLNGASCGDSGDGLYLHRILPKV